MLKKLYAILQTITPQHALSHLLGRIAESKNPHIKQFLIQQFMARYAIDLHEAEIEEAAQFASFNDFFTRKLKLGSRPIASQGIVSPVDGTIAALGTIQKNQLLQAKNFYFDLESLLSTSSYAREFYDGTYATLYLAPHNYHRVHMPLDGTLEKIIFVPGKLFSVNRMTSELIPNLYSRNERLICLFNTRAGKIAVILVGAMIVGSIQPAWMPTPIYSRTLYTDTFATQPFFAKGAELGLFKMGSTVILLFQQGKICLNNDLKIDDRIKLGQNFGEILY